jgi:D-proline reductase (dithiol) PrdB
MFRLQRRSWRFIVGQRCIAFLRRRFNLTKISEMPAVARGFISNLDLPVVYDPSWTQPVPANKRRISIVSTAAVHRRGDKPFSWLAKDFRAFDKTDRDLVMTHVAVEFDRSAWQQDLNTIIPLERLEEMADDGEIGSVAEEHYSFMGAADPVTMEKSARQAAAQMKQDGVNTVFLIPI